MAIDPVSGSLILGGASLAGSIFSASTQADAIQDAADKAAKIQKEMFKMTRKDYKPYRDIGIDALYEMAGYEKVTTPGKSRRVPVYDTKKVRNPNYDRHDPSSGSAYTTKKVLSGYKNVGGEDTIEWKKTGKGIDPTGGSKKYLNALEVLDFEFDPDDEVYKWRRDEGEGAINRFLASRGLHNSSYGADRLLDFNRDLQADEVGRQYNQNYLRKYGQNVDLFNMANKLGSQVYGKYLDLTNLGYGATGATGSAAINAGNALANIQGNLGNQMADVKGSFWAGAGAAPINALVGYGYGKDAGLWGQPQATVQPASAPYQNALYAHGRP